MNEFLALSYTVCTIGIFTSIYFIYSINEPFLTKKCIEKSKKIKKEREANKPKSQTSIENIIQA
jgi:hypothetical protein